MAASHARPASPAPRGTRRPALRRRSGARCAPRPAAPPDRAARRRSRASSGSREPCTSIYAPLVSSVNHTGRVMSRQTRRGQARDMSSNSSITSEIASRYEADPRILYPAEIALEERAGTVTLRGTVGDFRQRRAAVQIAEHVHGVRDVEDALNVDLRDHFDDAQLRGAALQALLDDHAVPSDAIEAKVSSAWLTLSGQVKHQSQSNAAFERSPTFRASAASPTRSA